MHLAATEPRVVVIVALLRFKTERVVFQLIDPYSITFPEDACNSWR
jgi:hypothetical protein